MNSLFLIPKQWFALPVEVLISPHHLSIFVALCCQKISIGAAPHL